MRRYLRQVRAYWRETRTPLDFLRLMQVRLSLSRVGRLACPHHVTRWVDVRNLGGPVALRSHTSDISVLGELLLGDAYGTIERHAPEHVHSILDLGANTGLAARWLMRRHPDARIMCVEPEPGNVEILRQNLAGTDAVIVPMCVGARERRVALASSTGEWGYRMTDEVGDVRVTTMDAILPWFIGSIDVLKCDIEGAEGELFEDAPWMDRVGVAVVECHGIPGERILPDGWRIVEREPNPMRPAYETVTLIHGSPGRHS